VPAEVRAKIKLHLVNHISQVIAVALAPPRNNAKSKMKNEK